MPTTTDEEARADLLGELAANEADIDACLEANSPRYQRRLELLEQGRRLGLTVREMAEAAGRRESAFAKAMHQARKSAT